MICLVYSFEDNTSRKEKAAVQHSDRKQHAPVTASSGSTTKQEGEFEVTMAVSASKLAIHEQDSKL